MRKVLLRFIRMQKIFGISAEGDCDKEKQYSSTAVVHDEARALKNKILLDERRRL